jgi:hypothetical protein
MTPGELEQPQRDEVEEALAALPVLARGWVRVTARGLEGSLRVSAALLRAARDPERATQLAEGMRGYARAFLGIEELEHNVRALLPLAAPAELDEPALRHMGEQLLARSADVHFDAGSHPAYARILSELVPDEARVLRLLASEGPQPVVDVRVAALIGSGSQLIAAALNMLDAHAGLRHRERTAIYVQNLARLGLIELAGEPLRDPRAYQLLEAQPQVQETIRRAARARVVRRKVELTALGADLVRVCLPLDRPPLHGNGRP